MKKIISLLICCATVFTLAGCNNVDSDYSESTQEISTPSAVVSDVISEPDADDN